MLTVGYELLVETDANVVIGGTFSGFRDDFLEFSKGVIIGKRYAYRVDRVIVRREVVKRYYAVPTAYSRGAPYDKLNLRRAKLDGLTFFDAAYGKAVVVQMRDGDIYEGYFASYGDGQILLTDVKVKKPVWSEKCPFVLVPVSKVSYVYTKPSKIEELSKKESKS